MKKSLAYVSMLGLTVMATQFIGANLLYGECPCQNEVASGEVVYESYTPAVQPYSPEMELEEVDRPEEMINFTVVVDEKAIVSVNGEPTVTKGSVRPYVVRGLKAGKVYVFEFQALVRRPQGDVYVAKEKVTIRAGDSKQVVLKVKRANRIDFPPPVLDGTLPPPPAA